ncbi:acyclic terpene utilization AtuA family protein [Kitasatospora sp. NPDC092948]|uniref:acyclic terpene utilization AtuA family protein n=1 Tax=Kitasatospora sp. NPDC092948 TaxID=3364088 RepID=UPI00380FF2C7
MPVLRIGNASGFYGDRFAAFREMLTGGPLDVLTGDYLAELTMLILARDRMRDPKLGYARTFLRQAEECLAEAMDRGVRIVVNAGGLNPERLAQALGDLAARQGVHTRIGYVTGDELLPRAAEFGWTGEEPRRPLLAANAYLGAFGIAECLRGGADVVVTGRVTDAALVVGPGIAHHGWTPDDLDALAGAVVAGHVLECGAQATGGNYAFFAEHGEALDHPGFPLAELHADGSSVITKHPGTGGVVTVETVTAQLLYETGGVRYLGPDVTARLDTVTLTADGLDRVRIGGVRGEAPPATLKVGLNRLGGYRNELVFVLTGLDIEAKAAYLQRQLTHALTDPPAELRWTLARTDRPDADTEERASALLRLTARDPQEAKVGRALTAAAVELGLAGYPGFHLTAPPAPASPYGVFEARELDAKQVEQLAHLPGGDVVPVRPERQPVDQIPLRHPELPTEPESGPTRRAPLGLVAGARSGDKGGDANLGVWARGEAGWRWLAHALTVEKIRELLPEAAELEIERHLLPNLRAVNFVIRGLLGEGVAAQARFDPQAKALGEWLRSRHLDIPEALL